MILRLTAPRRSLINSALFLKNDVVAAWLGLSHMQPLARLYVGSCQERRQIYSYTNYKHFPFLVEYTHQRTEFPEWRRLRFKYRPFICRAQPRTVSKNSMHRFIVSSCKPSILDLAYLAPSTRVELDCGTYPSGIRKLMHGITSTSFPHPGLDAKEKIANS